MTVVRHNQLPMTTLMGADMSGTIELQKLAAKAFIPQPYVHAKWVPAQPDSHCELPAGAPDRWTIAAPAKWPSGCDGPP